MKVIKTILVIICILVIIFGLYQGWNWYKNKTEKNQELEMIELLQKQQGLIVTLQTKISELEKRVVADTLKEKTVIKEDAETYETVKEELIELRKDEETNKEEIEAKRTILEERIDEFQKSPDKILINTGEDKIVIYEDETGSLASLQSGVTITRHREVEEVKAESEPVKIEIESEKDLGLKIGGCYNFNELEYNLVISKELIDIKDFSLNASLMSDLKDLEGIKLGANLNYSIKNNLELGVGITLDKDYFIVLEYRF